MQRTINRLPKRSRSPFVSPDKQTGSSMIEVLVALLILSIGSLGLVAVQITSLKNSNNSEFRYRASNMTADLIERMESNKRGVANNHYSAINVSTTNVPTANTTVADNDIAAWYQKVATLPGGVGVVTESGTSNEFTIVVRWNDVNSNNAQGVVAQSLTTRVSL